MMTRKNKVLSFTRGAYFPDNFIFLGAAGAGAGLLLFALGKPWAGAILLLLSLPLTFTRQGISLDPVNKTIKEFTGLFGLELGKKRPYDQLIKLVLKKERRSQTMNSRGSSTTIRYEVYNAYLITDRETLLLTSHKNQGRVMRKIETVADQLHLPLEIPG